MSKDPFKVKLAQVIRVVSVPPIMAATLAAILLLCKRYFFNSWFEFFATLFFLVFLPASSYLFSRFMPCLRKTGREGERNLAIIFSAAGYTGAWIYGLFFCHNKNLFFIYTIYFFSVVLLVVSNKLLHIRASGHGCSVTGPLMLAVYFFKLTGLLICVPIYAAILWASIVIKRHTPGEFLSGTAICLAAAALAWLFCKYIPIVG